MLACEEHLRFESLKAEVRHSSFTPAELQAGGVDLREIRCLGFGVQEFCNDGFSKIELIIAGFRAAEMLEVFSMDELSKELGVESLWEAGFSACSHPSTSLPPTNLPTTTLLAYTHPHPPLPTTTLGLYFPPRGR